MQLMIETLRATPIAQRRMELVERKGLGHPDTICEAELGRMPDFCAELIRGAYSVC